MTISIDVFSTNLVDPHSEQMKANLYNTLKRLGLTKGFYMNWNYVTVPGAYTTKIVGDTRW